MLSSLIYESSLYLKKRAIVSKAEEGYGGQNKKKSWRSRKEKTVKKRYQDKDESIRQYNKEKYLKSRTYKITNQKAKYQENPEVQL